MEKALKLLKDAFETEITEALLDEAVEDALVWDSFHMMNFLVEAQEQFHRRISVEELSAVRYVGDLVRLLAGEEDEPCF